MLFLPNNIDQFSRKEREKLYKRMEILNAAVSLFAEQGYGNTTIDHIAEKAQFGKGTIYNYFNSKEEIYWGIIDDIFDQYLESLQKIDEDNESFYDFIKEITSELFSFCVNNRHAFVMITRLRTGLATHTSKPRNSINEYQRKSDAIFLKRIEKAINSGKIRKVDPKSLLALYRSMIFPYVYNKMFCDSPGSIEIDSETDFVVNIFFNGIKN